jgi:pyruvate dehydrogenase E1 component beta subunit
VLAREGIEVEIIDLRCLAPWDQETVLASVRRTHRLVVAQETWPAAGFSAEVVATVTERALRDLHVPARRVGALPVPIPSGPLRRHALPTVDRLVDVVRQVVREEKM